MFCKFDNQAKRTRAESKFIPYMQNKNVSLTVNTKTISVGQ